MPIITQAEAGVLAGAVRKRARHFVVLQGRMVKSGRRGDPLRRAAADAVGTGGGVGER